MHKILVFLLLFLLLPARRQDSPHGADFVISCKICHSPKGWELDREIYSFDHSTTGLPLEGQHTSINCKACHPTLVFADAKTDCIDCHMQDYQSASNPNHVLGNFSTECVNCHLMYAFTWEGTGYNHSFFPLTEGHAVFDCNLCHDPNDYSNVSRECFSCHQDEYNATTNPKHPASGLSTDCKECHTTSPRWKPAEFRIHDAQFFPIYSGSHKGEWNSCTDCHTNPSYYSIFSCIDCHEHSRSRMDSEHSDKKGYVYASEACLDCHPTGRAD
ncbi:MAG: hypothetical protein V2B15_18645 [Bacteroidota bacterium]